MARYHRGQGSATATAGILFLLQHFFLILLYHPLISSSLTIVLSQPQNSLTNNTLSLQEEFVPSSPATTTGNNNNKQKLGAHGHRHPRLKGRQQQQQWALEGEDPGPHFRIPAVGTWPPSPPSAKQARLNQQGAAALFHDSASSSDYSSEVVLELDTNETDDSGFIEEIKIRVEKDGETYRVRKLPVVNSAFQFFLLVVIMIVSIMANGVIIINITRDSLKLKMIHFLLIRHVCLTDFFGTLFILPLPMVAIIRGEWTESKTSNLICSIISTTTALFWTMHLLAVALYRTDRVLAVWLPSGRYPVCSIRVVNICLILIWIIAIIGSYLATLAFGYTFQPALALCIPDVPIIFFIIVFSGYCIGLIALSTGYILAFARKRKRKRKGKHRSQQYLLNNNNIPPLQPSNVNNLNSLIQHPSLQLALNTIGIEAIEAIPEDGEQQQRKEGRQLDEEIKVGSKLNSSPISFELLSAGIGNHVTQHQVQAEQCQRHQYSIDIDDHSQIQSHMLNSPSSNELKLYITDDPSSTVTKTDTARDSNFHTYSNVPTVQSHFNTFPPTSTRRIRNSTSTEQQQQQSNTNVSTDVPIPNGSSLLIVKDVPMHELDEEEEEAAAYDDSTNKDSTADENETTPKIPVVKCPHHFLEQGYQVLLSSESEESDSSSSSTSSAKSSRTNSLECILQNNSTQQGTTTAASNGNSLAPGIGVLGQPCRRRILTRHSLSFTFNKKNSTPNNNSNNKPGTGATPTVIKIPTHSKSFDCYYDLMNTEPEQRRPHSAIEATFLHVDYEFDGTGASGDGVGGRPTTETSTTNGKDLPGSSSFDRMNRQIALVEFGSGILPCTFTAASAKAAATGKIPTPEEAAEAVEDDDDVEEDGCSTNCSSSSSSQNTNNNSQNEQALHDPPAIEVIHDQIDHYRPSIQSHHSHRHHHHQRSSLSHSQSGHHHHHHHYRQRSNTREKIAAHHHHRHGKKSSKTKKRAVLSYALSVGHLLLYLPAMFVVGLQGSSLPPGAALFCGIVVYCEFLIQPAALMILSHRLRTEIIRMITRRHDF